MKQKRGSRRAFALLGAMLVAAAFGGCGSSTEYMPPASGTLLSASTPTAGINKCAGCHADKANEWITTKHANLNVPGDLNSQGSPTLGQIGTCTKNCHDPNGDSANVALVSSLGTTARPVVGCEACHGPGSLHANAGGVQPISLLSNTTTQGPISWGTGTVPVSPQFFTCTFCHELLDSAGTGTATAAHDLGGSDAALSGFTGNQYIITDTHFARPNVWSTANGHNTAAGIFAISGYAMDYAGDKVCIDCHDPHGVVSINQEWALSAHGDRTANVLVNENVNRRDPQGYFSGAWSVYNWSCDGTSTVGCGSFGVPSNWKQCQHCHTTTGFQKFANALSTGDQATASGMRLGTLSALTYTSGFKPEMLKCNGCHTDNEGTLRNPGAVTAVYTIVTGTTTYSQVSFAFPQVSKSNVCLACHTGLQNGDAIKNLNAPGSPAFDFNNQGFINSHYLTGGGTVFTSSGYEYDGRSYENPSSYLHIDIGMNNFRSTGTNGPCVGCHMSRPNGNGNHIFLPVSRFNRVRYNSGSVTVANGSAVVTGASTTWTTAGIDTVNDVFKAPDGRLYQIASVDSDTQITLTSAYQGASAAGQIYIIIKSGNHITGISSEVCFNCHAGSSTALADQLNEDREQFEDSLLALQQLLDKRGFCFIDSYPYFQKLRYNAGSVSVTTGSRTVIGSGTALLSSGTSTVTDRFRAYDGNLYEILSVDSDTQLTLKTPYLGPNAVGSSYAIFISGSAANQKDWDPLNIGGTNGGTVGKNNMGAAFNYNLLDHDPGAYVHNRTYVKRLIYDAIDWLDDNSMNNSVGATLSALGTEPYKQKAMQYILPNGVLGIPAERP